MNLAAAIAAGATHVDSTGQVLRAFASGWLAWVGEGWTQIDTAPDNENLLTLVPRTEQLQSIATDGKYHEVLEPFVQLMQRELHANSGKGDRPAWLKVDSKEGLLEIFYHVGKLQKALKKHDLPGTVEYAVDVANLCMMMLDSIGALVQTPAVIENMLDTRDSVWVCRDCGAASEHDCKVDEFGEGSCGGGYEPVGDTVLIPNSDLRVDLYRLGPWPDFINHPATAARVTHLPTGFWTDSAGERSAYQNTKKAKEMLLNKLNVHALLTSKSAPMPIPPSGRPGQVTFYDENERRWEFRVPSDHDYTWAQIQAELYRDDATNEWKAVKPRYHME